MKLLIVGATGLVGSHVLRIALSDPRIQSIVAPARKVFAHANKLEVPVVDFDNLPAEASWWGVDAVICTLGTTMNLAGSEGAFRRVDHDYPLAIARLSKQHGATAYVLNSAHGANTTSPIFYYQVKGEVENDLATVGFPSLTYVRPGFIGGKRREFRLGERVMVLALGLIGPIIPKRFRLNPAEKIAKAMLESAIQSSPGTHVISSEMLT